MSDKKVLLVEPVRPWWPGDPIVEPYMPRVRRALERHIEKLGQDAHTDIYNRAYEAVYEAIKDFDKRAGIANVLRKEPTE